jgi:hypothetical protein
LKFRSAILLALESWFIRDQNALVQWASRNEEANASVLRSVLEREGLALEGMVPRQTDIARADSKLLLYAPSDFIAGTHVLYRNRLEPPEPWAEAIVRSFLRGYLINQYLTWVSLTEFDPARIDDLVAEVRTSGLSVFDALIEKILPTTIGDHVVVPNRGKARAVCVLYLEPETQLPFNLKYGKTSQIDASIQPLRALFGWKEIAAIAHPQADLLLMRGQNWSPPEIELAAMRFRPLPAASDETVMCLPATAFDLALALSYFPIYRHMAEQLRTHPFIAARSDEYARKISETPHLYDAYEKTFVRERASASLLAMESDGCTEELAQRIASNRFFASAQDGASKGIEFDADGEMFVKSQNNIIETLRTELRTIKCTVAQRIRLLKDRERAYSEFLRDILIAQSTRESIKLQSVIRLLSVAAVMVGLLAVVMGLLTDRMKSAVLDWLL